MPLRNLKYRNKVRVLFIPVFALMAAGLLIIYHITGRTLKDEHRERLLRTAHLTDEGLTATEKEMVKMANLFQTNRTLKEYLYLSTVLGGDRGPLRDLLEPLTASLEIDDLDLYDARGRRVLSLDSANRDDPGEERLTGVTGSVPTAVIHGFSENSRTLKIMAVSPLRVKNSIVGYIAVGKYIDAGYLKALKEISGNELFRVNARNRVITDTGAEPALYSPREGRLERGGTTYSVLERDLAGINGRPLGKLIIALSNDDLNASKKRLMLSMFGMLTAAALMSWVLSRLFISALVDPLKTITRFTGNVARGKLEEKVPVRGRDELAVLAENFNEMQRQLKTQRALVEQYTANLEQAVAERTAELERVQHQLLHSQKMEAIGQLSGGIAHDFNNFLTAIRGYADMLKKRLRHDDFLQNLAGQIIEATRRATTLTRGLLAFSRKQMITTMPLDLNAVVRNEEQLLARLIREDISLTSSLQDGPLAVLGDAPQLEQVIMNLVTNARDAMPEGGRLTIRTCIREIGDEFIRSRGFGRRGTYAVLSVSDTGTGMDAAVRQKIFEPFFTTKEVGKGTGLGLAIVYGIVKQHDGYIDVESEPGKGSTFNVYLPIMQQDVRAWQAGEQALPPRGGAETVLLAEDDSAVRELAKTALEEAGYRVIPAADGKDAVERFVKECERIQLLILDVIMPRKNGKAAYDEIKSIKPDIKVLFTSGYTADILDARGVTAEGLCLIQKPLSPDDLLRRVRAVLDGADPCAASPLNAVD